MVTLKYVIKKMLLHFREPNKTKAINIRRVSRNISAKFGNIIGSVVSQSITPMRALIFMYINKYHVEDKIYINKFCR